MPKNSQDPNRLSTHPNGFSYEKEYEEALNLPRSTKTQQNTSLLIDRTAWKWLKTCKKWKKEKKLIKGCGEALTLLKEKKQNFFKENFKTFRKLFEKAQF